MKPKLPATFAAWCETRAGQTARTGATPGPLHAAWDAGVAAERARCAAVVDAALARYEDRSVEAAELASAITCGIVAGKLPG